jgi:tetratricopeptide (TPR) repeat protein
MEGPKFFISYSTDDGIGYANHLYNALKKIQHDAFLAGEDLATGDNYKPKIFAKIRGCDIFVLIGTRIALDTEWVEDEFVEALNLGKELALCIYHKIEKAELSELRVGRRIVNNGKQYARFYDYDGGGGSNVVQIVFDRLAEYVKSTKSQVEQNSYKNSLEQIISEEPPPKGRRSGGNYRLGLSLDQVISDAIKAASDPSGFQNTGLTEESTSNETEAVVPQSYPHSHEYDAYLKSAEFRSHEYDEYLKSAEPYEDSLNTQNLKFALQQIEGAIEIDPQRSIGWTKKGKVLEKLGRWDEARESFDRAKELFRKYST